MALHCLLYENQHKTDNQCLGIVPNLVLSRLLFLIWSYLILLEGLKVKSILNLLLKFLVSDTFRILDILLAGHFYLYELYNNRTNILCDKCDSILLCWSHSIVKNYFEPPFFVKIAQYPIKLKYQAHSGLQKKIIYIYHPHRQ